MKHPTPVVLAWSGGKDCSYALYQLLKDKNYEVRYLLSTINGLNRRLSMHGVREELIEVQAAAIGIPLLKVYVYGPGNREYEQQMGNMLLKLRATGIRTIAFGDIFLEDLRVYREEKMGEIGMNCLFPIWKRDTRQLVTDFIARGFKTYTCCINDGFLDKSWCGRLIDAVFLKDLPSSVDPCGENGEFHSFCFEGPLFKIPFSIEVGEKIYKALEIDHSNKSDQTGENKTSGFWYCDLQYLRD